MTKDEALDLAHGYLDRLIRGLNMDDTSEAVQVRDAIKQALAAPVQEPVALEAVYETIIHWDEGGGKRSRRELARRIVDLYTTPPAAPVQEPVAWKNAAIRLGEELSSVGPDGYYDMTAEQWLDWALDQRPRGKNTIPPAQEFVCSTGLCHYKANKENI